METDAGRKGAAEAARESIKDGKRESEEMATGSRRAHTGIF